MSWRGLWVLWRIPEFGSRYETIPRTRSLLTMLLESHIHKMAIDLPLGGTNEFLPPPGRIPAPSDWNPQPGCAFL